MENRGFFDNQNDMFSSVSCGYWLQLVFQKAFGSTAQTHHCFPYCYSSVPHEPRYPLLHTGVPLCATPHILCATQYVPFLLCQGIVHEEHISRIDYNAHATYSQGEDLSEDLSLGRSSNVKMIFFYGLETTSSCTCSELHRNSLTQANTSSFFKKILFYFEIFAFPKLLLTYLFSNWCLSKL